MTRKPLLAVFPLATLLLVTIASRVQTTAKVPTDVPATKAHLTELARELHQLPLSEIEQRFGPPAQNHEKWPSHWRYFFKNGVEVAVRFGAMPTPERVCVSVASPRQDTQVGSWPPQKSLNTNTVAPQREHRDLKDSAI